MTSRESSSREWLAGLAHALELHGGRDFPTALIDAIYHQARDDGMGGRDASRVALRCCKLALLLLDGRRSPASRRPQRVLAVELGVSERTGKLDAQRLRRVLESHVLLRRGPIGQSAVKDRAAVQFRAGANARNVGDFGA
jgi:hypothetical protein